MSTFAIGDLQGCYQSLLSLLNKIRFSSATDKLWFVGDLVNRGPGSLECLRFVRQLGSRAITVLGNHDLHLLGVAEGFRELNDNDTLQPILDAPDRDELLCWLRQQRLLYIKGQFAMVHAGLLPAWSWQEAQALAVEVESVLRGTNYRSVLKNMYCNEPDYWHPDLDGADRQRVVINAMTRMRVLSADTRMQFKFKGGLDDLPPKHKPWFKVPTARSPDYTIISGHWSALGFYSSPHFIGLDSGCVWGNKLTALRLEDRAIFQVPCLEKSRPKGLD